MRCRLTMLLLVLAAHLAAAAARAAEPAVFTIEAQAMLSDVAVAGEIAEVNGAIVKVTVNETFRGPDNSSWSLVWTDTIPAAEVGRECILFINAADDGLRHDLHATGCIPLDGSGSARDVSLRQISRREDLLSALREVRDVTAPLVYLYTTSPTTGQVAPRIVVPKVRKLEILAREWLRSPDDGVQWTGISAVSNFRSPDNVEALKPLLSDTSFAYGFGGGRWKSGTYVKRERAIEVLKNWQQEPATKIDVVGPVLFHEAVPASTARSFAGVVVLWVALVAVLRSAWRRRAGLPFRIGSLLVDTLSGVLLLIVVLVGWLWHRSHHVVDELVFGTGRAHHEIASYRGGMQYLVVKDWDWDTQFRYGVFAPTWPMSAPNQLALRWPNGPFEDAPQYRRGQSPPEDAWDIDAYTLTSKGYKWGVRWGSGSERSQSIPTRRGAALRGPTLNLQVVRVPYAWIIPFVALLPLMRLPMWIRQWRRSHKGLCPMCGYDVRITPDACPECGWRRTRKSPGATPETERPTQPHSV